jgi:hypothetical protein
VTFPRSGHNLLYQLLKHVLKNDFSYCEYYTHCQKTPCSSDAQFQKNHDFDLDLPIEKNVKYIVQYRHPYESIASLYNFDLDHGKIKNDDISNWQSFLNHNLDYYIKFLHKWVTNKEQNQFLHIKYSDLISSSQSTLWRIIKFAKKDAKVSKQKAFQLASQIIINKPKQCSEFKFYDEKDLALLNSKAHQLLSALNIKEVKQVLQPKK